MLIKPLNMPEVHKVDQERLNGLFEASKRNRESAEKIDSYIDTMTDEEVDEALKYYSSLENEERKGFTVIGEGDSPKISVNYRTMPQNELVTERVLPKAQEAPSQNFMYQPPQQQERIGYKEEYGFYHLNPRNYYSWEQMDEHFKELEAERKKKCDLDVYLQMISIQSEAIIEHRSLEEYQEEIDAINKQYGFVPAKELMEARRKQMELMNNNNNSQNWLDDPSYKYDERGIREQTTVVFSLVKIHEDGRREVVYTNKDKIQRNEKGEAVVYKSLAEDRMEKMEKIARENEIAKMKAKQEAIANLGRWYYLDAQRRHARWREEGKNVMLAQLDYETDYKSAEKNLMKFIDKQTDTYTQEDFYKILNSCCDTSLTYSNASKVFRISYDFARDIHRLNLMKTPEEMENDQRLMDKLKEEYELKKRDFMEKVLSRNLRCDMTNLCREKPTFPKPNIDEMTLEDHLKPENNIPYDHFEDPRHEMKSIFADDWTEEEKAKIKDCLDENGRPKVLKRTITTGSLDDLPPEERDFIENSPGITQYFDENGVEIDDPNKLNNTQLDDIGF